MIRQIFILLLISIVCVYFMTHITWFMHFIDHLHSIFVKQLSLIFAGGKIGMMVKEVVALVLIPLIIAAIPAIIYWFIKRQHMPYFADILWVTWIMLLTSVALH